MLALRLLWRDWRGGEMGILASALVIAVAIVTGIALFADQLQNGLRSQSSHFLAADAVLTSPRAVDPLWLQQADQLGLRQANTVGFRSMLYVGDEDDLDTAMQLSVVRAVSDAYPLKGQLAVSEQGFGQSNNTTEVPKPGQIWLDSRLLPLLDLSIGDSVNLGEISLRIDKVVVSEPDRGSENSGFAPRAMINLADLAATAVIQPGSRVNYRYLFAGDAVALVQYQNWLGERLGPSQRWLTIQDSQPRIGQSLKRAEQFLLLAGSLGVALAGIAIALAARRYSERHYDHVAIMRSLGASANRVLGMYLLNLLVLALAAMLLGWLLGWLIQESFVVLLRSYFQVELNLAPSLRPFVMGAVTALVCLLSFALPPLASLKSVSPLRVLRRDLEPGRLSNVLSVGLGIIGIGGLMYWYSRNATITLILLAAVAMILLLLGSISWYLLRGSRALGMQAGSSWRLAMASLRRRGLQNAVQTVIFSLAIMLLLLLVLVRSSLIEDWQLQLPEKTPNHFLLNIAGDENEALEQLFREQQIDSQPLYPVIRGRLQTINDTPLQEWLKRYSQGRRGGIGGERTMTTSPVLPASNVLQQGRWWQPGTTAREISLEVELAQRLNIKLGDKLEFLIGSEPLIVSVSSFRKLDWDSLKPNFFMVLPEAVLKEHPATYMTSFYLPLEQKRFLNQLLRAFPTVTVIEMDAVLSQLRTIIAQVSRAISLVLGLIVVSAVLVLIASVQASIDSRLQESAIIRALGAKRGLVMGSLVIEFILLGALAGGIAAGAAELAVFALQENLLQIDYRPHFWVYLVGPLLGALLIGLTGYAICRRVVNVPPVDVLRSL